MEEVTRVKRVSAVALLTLLLGSAHGEAAPARFVPFQEFLESTKAASFFDYAGSPESRVKDAAAFEEMRRHILDMYEGVRVTHSFVLDTDHIDCVPVMQQPSVRLLGIKKIATPPPPPALHREPVVEDAPAAEGLIQRAVQLGVENSLDEFGNSTACEGDTIALRRITIDELTRFPTLQRFFEKSPNESVPGLESVAAVGSATGVESAAGVESESDSNSIVYLHAYSSTHQDVNNLGGNSAINLWNPPVISAWNEVFSLSQEWYIAGAGDARQTLEVGWVVWPKKYGGSPRARLFIYWTADNYKKTGCWNLECKAFVEIPSPSILGVPWLNYSVYGGKQWEFEAEYYIYGDNMWLAINGVWIGYYPNTIFNLGQMTLYATQIQFGSEAVSIDKGAATRWAAEGSGAPSDELFGKAAYQRDLYYISTSGDLFEWDSLERNKPFSKCYSITGPFKSNVANWNRYFYEGGPGGYGC